MMCVHLSLDIPLIAGGPSHYFNPNQIQGHVLPAPVPIYPCPGPPILPVLTYPHSVVLGPGGLYVSVVPMPTSLSNNIVSTSFPYHPVTMTSGNSAVYPSRPIMMGPVDARFPSCPVTMPCPSVPALVNPVLQEPSMPLTAVYIPPGDESLVEGVANGPRECADPEAATEDFLKVGELLDVLPVESNLLLQSEQCSTEAESVWQKESRQAGDEEPHLQPTSDGCSGDASKLRSNSVNDKGLAAQNSPSFQSSGSGARRSSMASESSASGEVRNGPLPQVEPDVQKPKSWASLLHNTTSAANAIVVNAGELSAAAVKASAADESVKLDRRLSCESGLSNTVSLQEDKAELMS